jgi:hypothetical protein
MGGKGGGETDGSEGSSGRDLGRERTVGREMI